MNKKSADIRLGGISSLLKNSGATAGLPSSASKTTQTLLDEPAVAPSKHVTRRGFTLIEAMVSLTVLGIAGSAALLTLCQTTQTTDASIRSQIALGMAQQLLDEQCSKLYMRPGESPYDTTLGPSASEAALPGRQYSSLGDYNGVNLQPPTDQWGIPLGTDDGDGTTRDPAFQVISNCFSRWRQQVSVSYVQSTALTTPLPAGTTSNYRLTNVQISYDDPVLGWQVLASYTRVFAYVPTP